MTLSRRTFVAGAAGFGLGAAGMGGALALIERGILPGHYRLASLLGECDVPASPVTYGLPGPTVQGAFRSTFRNRSDGYEIAYPPRHRPGDRLPLVVFLHGYGGSYRDALAPSTPGKALAMRLDDQPLPPIAMVTVDGGLGYWNPHPGDDPFRMVLDELIPLCRRKGLGDRRDGVAVAGVSMGGYGALLFGERARATFRAVAAISPAIWTTYGHANAANPNAYASPSAFRWADVVTHASLLTGLPTRISIGYDDPFLAGVQALEPRLPPDANLIVSKGCHSGPFFAQQLAPSLAFLARYLGPR